MTIIHHNRRPATDDRTRFDPGMTPYTIEPERANSCRGTVFNAAREPIATIEANSPRQLSEIGRIIESAMRSDDARYYANKEQRAAQRNLNQGHR